LRASARKIQAEAWVEAIIIQAEAWVEAIIGALPILPFARAHARLGAHLARKGVTIGAHDLLIGASALARGCAVITKDRRSFPKIPELEVVLL